MEAAQESRSTSLLDNDDDAQPSYGAIDPVTEAAFDNQAAPRAVGGNIFGHGVNLWRSTNIFGTPNTRDDSNTDRNDQEDDVLQDIADLDRVFDEEGEDDDFESPSEGSYLLHNGGGDDRREWFPRFPRHRF